MPVISVGWVLALLVLLMAIVLWVIGRIDPVEALMFVGLSLARLVP